MHDLLREIIWLKSKSDECLEKRDETILVAVQEGVTVQEIAKAVAMSRRGIYDILRRQGHAYGTTKTE